MTANNNNKNPAAQQIPFEREEVSHIDFNNNNFNQGPVNKKPPDNQYGFVGNVEQPSSQEIFYNRNKTNLTYSQNKNENSQLQLSSSSSSSSLSSYPHNENRNDQFVQRPVSYQPAFQEQKRKETPSQPSGNGGYYGNNGEVGNWASNRPESQNNFNENGNSDSGQKFETSTPSTIEFHSNINIILPTFSLTNRNTDHENNQRPNTNLNNQNNHPSNNNYNNKIPNKNHSQESSGNGNYRPPLSSQSNNSNNNSGYKKPQENTNGYGNFQSSGSKPSQSNKNNEKQSSISSSNFHNSGSGRPQNDRNNAMPNVEHPDVNVLSTTRIYERGEGEEEEEELKFSTKNNRYE